MQVKTENGVRDVPVASVTAGNFIVPKGEEHLYHCKIEIRRFNPNTGERVSAPRIQVFGRKFFESFGLHNLRQQGYTVEILHNPTAWIAEHKEAAEKAAATKAAATKAAEKAALKAEILAELQAAGVIAAPTDGKAKTTKAAEKAAATKKNDK